MIKIGKVLCPLDFSAGSDHALEYAVAFAALNDAELHILHVLQPIAYGIGVDGIEAAAEADAIGHVEDVSRERLAQIATSLRERHARVAEHFVVGTPATEIVRVASDDEIDLIVMGTRGRTGLAHVLLGSVAERVVRRAPCPVLTVKHPEHEFLIA